MSAMVSVLVSTLLKFLRKHACCYESWHFQQSRELDCHHPSTHAHSQTIQWSPVSSVWLKTATFSSLNEVFRWRNSAPVSPGVKICELAEAFAIQLSGTKSRKNSNFSEIACVQKALHFTQTRRIRFVLLSITHHIFFVFFHCGRGSSSSDTIKKTVVM